MLWIIGGVLLGVGLLISLFAPEVGAWIACAGCVILVGKCVWMFLK